MHAHGFDGRLPACSLSGSKQHPPENEAGGPLTAPDARFRLLLDRARSAPPPSTQRAPHRPFGRVSPLFFCFAFARRLIKPHGAVSGCIRAFSQPSYASALDSPAAFSRARCSALVEYFRSQPTDTVARRSLRAD
jgi:hypothetical protein